MLSRVLLFVLMFVSVQFSNVVISFGEDRAGLSRASVCLFCTRRFLSFFSSSWCRGLACDCGTPTAFLLTIFQVVSCFV